jgi:uncharacterized protein (TIGR04141 family)
MPSIKPTIYLIKDDVTNPDGIFKRNAMGLTVNIQGNYFLYSKSSNPTPPRWSNFIRSNFNDVNEHFFNSSSYAIIVIRTVNRFFAIPLGMGMHEIDQSKIEYNFGIKVAINTVEPTELKQIDLTTPEINSQKTKKQASKKSTPEDFGVNKSKDILKGLVGRLPENHPLGDNLQGKDSLRLAVSIENLEDLERICRLSLEYSNQNFYQEHYPWIDNLSIIVDPTKIDFLYSQLISAIQENNVENMYIAPPDFIEDLYEYTGVQFTGNRNRNRQTYSFPTMQNWVDELGDDFIIALTQDHLKKSCKLKLVDSDGDRDTLAWSMHRCISWECNDNDERYILSEGNWYKIGQTFYDETNNYFNNVMVERSFLPDMPGRFIKEEEYNQYVCELEDKYKLFDLGHKSSRHKSIGKNRNEICDIFDSEEKKFIHVKQSKDSPAISHLMRQGYYSALILKTDQNELQTFRGYLEQEGCTPDTIPEPFNPKDYEIIFVCIIEQNQRISIPFFSKVTLKDTFESLINLMNYRCSFHFIHLLPPLND